MERIRRPIRLLLTVQAIRNMDAAIDSGVGGFESRDELVEEAINSYLLELDELAMGRANWTEGLQYGDGVQDKRATEPGAQGLVPINTPTTGYIGTPDPVFLDDSPLLGLHNRDWPSFWALGRLALRATNGPVDFRTYLDEVTDEAWSLAEELKLTLGPGSKVATQMLPTNTDKKQSSDAGFQNFAVGTISNKPSRTGLHKAGGPLPTWRAVAFSKIGATTQISLTEAGWQLMGIVQHLPPQHPHDRSVAAPFLEYLQAHAPNDWWGFETTIREVAREPSRDALLARMESARKWTPSVASSATQGYIARCREWGLIEPKLVEGRYRLTAFGKEISQNVQ